MKRSDKLKEQLKREKEKLKARREKQAEKLLQKKLKRLIKAQRKEMKVGTWKDIFKRTRHEKLLVINMELKNGHHDTFYIAEDGDSFKYRGKRYVFDEKMKWYNIKFQLSGYDYHEGFSLPIKREFPLEDVKTAISESKIIETEYATNPSILERFMNSSIIEMMLSGGSIDKMMKMAIVIISIVAVISLSHLILFMNETGMFENLG